MKIVELMEVTPQSHDLAWLKEALEAAVELEFATIPPYLCSMWSIKDTGSEVYDLIYKIVLQETGHIHNLADFERVQEIKHQGEGTTQEPYGDPSNMDLAHYYRFPEIHHGRKLLPVDGKFRYEGGLLPFPEVYPSPGPARRLPR